jgi:hypothetical protein
VNAKALGGRSTITRRPRVSRARQPRGPGSTHLDRELSGNDKVFPRERVIVGRPTKS